LKIKKFEGLLPKNLQKVISKKSLGEQLADEYRSSSPRRLAPNQFKINIETGFNQSP
jgi:hypothetical protein